MNMKFARIEKKLLKISRNKLDIQFDLEIERTKNKYLEACIQNEDSIDTLIAQYLESLSEIMHDFSQS